MVQQQERGLAAEGRQDLQGGPRTHGLGEHTHRVHVDDIDVLVASLKNNGTSKEHSLALWNRMLVMSVARIVAGIYATALLSLTFKAQVLLHRS